jgi:outer membrane protein assembly factor BamB
MKIAMRTLLVLTGSVLLVATSAPAQDWPQWRGPGRDNHVTGFTPPKTWPSELKMKWKVPVGEGIASPVLVGDKVYVFGRDGGDEVIRCLEAASGKEIWKDGYAAVPVGGPAKLYPGPRSTPAVGEGKVCTLGVSGILSCLHAASGKVVWRKKTGGKPAWDTSTSPIIVDGKCIVYVDELAAYDLATGNRDWHWKGGGAPYGSPILINVDGVQQVVTPAMGELAGVALADGKPLWHVNIGPGGKDYQHTFSTPLADGPVVYYSVTPKGGFGKGGKGGKGAPPGGGAGSGTLALKIEKKDGGFVATELWKKPQSAHQYHTPLLKDGLIFGVTPRLHFYCMDAKTGEDRWVDDKTTVGQCGAILDVGPVLLSLSSNKELIAFKASPKGFDEVAHYQVGGGKETWAVPILTGNRIYVRDRESLLLWTIE